MKKYSRHQSGWIAKFVIIGVALLLTLLLGVYFLKSQAKTSQTRVDHPTNIAKDGTDKSSSDSNASGDKNNVDKALPSGPSDNSQPNASANNSNGSSSTPAPQPSSSPDAGVGALPHTGPETTAAQLAVIAMLAFTVTLYVRSRRTV